MLAAWPGRSGKGHELCSRQAARLVEATDTALDRRQVALFESFIREAAGDVGCLRYFNFGNVNNCRSQRHFNLARQDPLYY